mgnify:CR=1 FL=1
MLRCFQCLNAVIMILSRGVNLFVVSVIGHELNALIFYSMTCYERNGSKMSPLSRKLNLFKSLAFSFEVVRNLIFDSFDVWSACMQINLD